MAGALAVAAATTWLVDRAAVRAAERDVALRYVAAWSRADGAGMHALLDDRSRRRWSRGELAALTRTALRTATLAAATPERPRHDGDRIVVPVVVRTHAFGTVRGDLGLPLRGTGERARIAWSPGRTFPGLRPGERLRRQTALPPRADLLAREGTPLARGPARTSDAPDVAGQVTGAVGPAAPEDRARLARRGVPAGARVGTSGLERILDDRLRGRAGGRLIAGDRELARTRPRAAPAVRSSISPTVVRAAVRAQAEEGGAATSTGTTVLDAATGEVLAVQGVAFSGLQPPGSTLKVLSAATALTRGDARADQRYPEVTETTIAGTTIENADAKLCGGTFVRAFALSCNSVFAPLGAEVGARALADAADRFGFGRPLAPGVPPARFPDPDELRDPVSVAVASIGQGTVLANTLQVAILSATVARGGTRPQVTFVPRRGPTPQVRVLEPAVARTMRRAMEAAVREGTGERAAVDGVRVAGKTGTAELEQTQGLCDPLVVDPQAPGCGPERTDDTTAWMTAFAPAEGRAPVAVAVMRERDGQGGDTAAPVAARVLRAALERRGPA